MEQFKMFIGGEFVEASSGKTMECIDPGTGKPFAAVPSGGAADANAAIEAAQKAFDAGVWSDLSPGDRCTIIMEWADHLEMIAPRLTMYESMDSGHTLFSAGGGLWMAVRSLRNLAWYAANKFPWREEVPMSGALVGFGRNVIVREPMGVCVCILPWNQPLVMAVWKIAHAIATGNTMVIKPASDTPVSALILAESIVQSQIPKGVINIVTGPGSEIGEALCTHPDVRRITFTGSTEVGKRIMQLGSETLKRVTLELGGKSANIIREDADLDLAVDAGLFGIFFHNGQICVSGSRLLVAAAIYEEFLERLKKRVKDIVQGYQMLPEAKIGPMVSKKQIETVERYVAIGKEEGARLLCGGKRSTIPGFENGYYFEPTIFADVDNKMRIAQEEIFGPVLCVIPFKNDDEAVRIANDTTYGLAGAVWTKDIARAEKIAGRVKTGTLWINDYADMADFVPFGGFKQSGIGREFGLEGLSEFTEVKRIYVSPDGDERPNWIILFNNPLPKTFSFKVPTKLIAGPGTHSSISAELMRLGCKRALIVTDKGLAAAGIVDRIVKSMGDYCAGVFDGVDPDPGYECVDAAVARFKEVNADSLVSLGGGSSIDTAKGVAVTIKNGGRAIDNISVYRLIEPQVPHIAVPTTHGTGSEVTLAAVIKNSAMNKKFMIAEQNVIPNVAILDSTLVTGLPKAVTIGTGMDALTHAVESMMNKNSNPITSACAFKAIRMIVQYLPRVADDGNDLEARHYMLVASTLAGFSEAAGTGVGHGLAHSVGTACHVHHGTACGIGLPHVIRHNKDYCPDSMPEIAQALGVEGTSKMSPAEAAEAAAEAVTALLKRVGHPTRYREVGMTEEMKEQMVAAIMTDGANYGTPRPLDPESLALLVKASF